MKSTLQTIQVVFFLSVMLGCVIVSHHTEDFISAELYSALCIITGLHLFKLITKSN